MALSGKLQIENRQGFLWIIMPKSITATNLLSIQKRIESHISGSSERVVIDLVNMDTVNSVLASLIINIRNRINDSGGAIGLVNVSKKCMVKLQLMQLDRVLTVYEDESEIKE